MAKPGDPILDVYTAAWYNKVDKRVNKNITGIPALQNLSQQSYIWVENHEAVAKDQFTVVALSAPAFLTSDRVDNVTNETVWQTTDLSTGDPDNIFILLDPLPGEIGAQARALVSGVSLLKTVGYTPDATMGQFFQYEGPTALDLLLNDTGRIQSISKFTDGELSEYYLVVAGPIVAARRNWIGFLYASYRGIVSGFWVVPTIELDGILPTGPQWVVNMYSWNFGVAGATVRVEEDVINNRWLALQQEYICPDNRTIDTPPPEGTPPPYPYPE